MGRDDFSYIGPGFFSPPCAHYSDFSSSPGPAERAGYEASVVARVIHPSSKGRETVFPQTSKGVSTRACSGNNVRVRAGRSFSLETSSIFQALELLLVALLFLEVYL